MLRFVINLDRSKDRLKYISGLFAEMNLRFIRMPGVDGKKLNDEKIKELTPPLASLSKACFPREISKSEIGCFLSHRKCWQSLVDSGEKWALVMEDDILFSNDAKKYIETDNWIPAECQLVQLSVSNGGRVYTVHKKQLTTSFGSKLYLAMKPHTMGTGAYFISKEAAQDAINLSQKILTSVDEFLYSPLGDFGLKHDTWKIYPPLVTNNENIETTQSIPENQKKSPIWVRVYPKRIYRKIKLSLRRRLAKEKINFIFRK